MKERLRGLLSANAPRLHDTAASTTALSSDAPPEWILRLIDARRAQLPDTRGQALVALSYEPRPDCFFNGDDPLQTMRKVPHLLAIRIEARGTLAPHRRARSLFLQPAFSVHSGRKPIGTRQYFPPRPRPGAHDGCSFDSSEGAEGKKPILAMTSVSSGPS
jgi:hypothetical protein